MALRLDPSRFILAAILSLQFFCTLFQSPALLIPHEPLLAQHQVPEGSHFRFNYHHNDHHDDDDDDDDVLVDDVDDAPPHHFRRSFGSAMARPGAEAFFRRFIRRYGKLYSSRGEYLRRLEIFEQNLARALRHQELDPGAVHGITPFSDLSEEEFERDFLGLAADPRDSEGMFPLGRGLVTAPILPVDELPQNFDWREQGAVTDVKSQGLCGACWAFTTTGVLEGALFLSTGRLFNLSQQQLIDCDRKCDRVQTQACDSGCRGGLMTNAYEYIKEAGGLMAAEDYPYKGSVEQCSFDPQKVAVELESFSSISLDEDQIAANLVKHGPLAVGLNAAFMQTYVGGVSCPLLCNKRFVNHGVLLVGYQKSGFAPLRLGNRPYWILKNSWGPHWGDQGFYKLCRGAGECGINTMVSAAVEVTLPSSSIQQL